MKKTYAILLLLISACSSPLPPVTETIKDDHVIVEICYLGERYEKRNPENNLTETGYFLNGKKNGIIRHFKADTLSFVEILDMESFVCTGDIENFTFKDEKILGNMRIKVPENWERVEITGDNFALKSKKKLESGFRPNITFLTEDANGYSLEEYIISAKALLSDDGHNVKFIQEGAISINGIPAYQMVYTMQSNVMLVGVATVFSFYDMFVVIQGATSKGTGNEFMGYKFLFQEICSTLKQD